MNDDSFDGVIQNRVILNSIFPDKMRFIHISDIHYDPNGDGGDSDSLREGLVNYLKNLVDRGLIVDELFVTGDYRNAVSQKEQKVKEDAKTTSEYLKRIADVLGIKDLAHVHLIPGNHDLNRKKLDTDRISAIQEEYKRLSGVFSEASQKDLLSQFYFFRTITYSFYGSKNNHWRWNEHPIHTAFDSENATYIYLNTAILHHSNSDRGKLLVGVNELEKLLREIAQRRKDLPIIILAHHSPEFFAPEERAKVESLCTQYRIGLYLCGDAHAPWWRMINGHFEFTTGSIRGQDGKSTFMYGDLSKFQFTAYEWDKYHGWGTFSAFNSSLSSFVNACIQPSKVQLLSETVDQLKKEKVKLTEDKNRLQANNDEYHKLIYQLGTGEKDIDCDEVAEIVEEVQYTAAFNRENRIDLGIGYTDPIKRKKDVCTQSNN